MNKKKIITIVVIFIFGIGLIIANIILTNKKDETKGIKQLSSRDYVYEVKKLPVINIDNKEIKNINQEIANLYYKIDTYNDSSFTYKYNVLNDILSLVIETSIYEAGDSTTVNFDVYNIDIKNGKLLDNNEFLEKNKITTSDVESAIYNGFNNYHTIEIEHSLIEESCDMECYLNLYEVDLNNMEYKLYSKDKNIYVYKFFNIGYEMATTDYFPKDIYIFKVK